MLFCGRRDWIKKFLKLRLGFAGQVIGQHELTLITDRKEVLPLIYQEDKTFSYAAIHYNAWSYGVNFFPYPQVEKIGYDSVYFSWIISNNHAGEKMTINSQSLEFSYVKMTK